MHFTGYVNDFQSCFVRVPPGYIPAYGIYIYVSDLVDQGPTQVWFLIWISDKSKVNILLTKGWKQDNDGLLIPLVERNMRKKAAVYWIQKKFHILEAQERRNETDLVLRNNVTLTAL